jgi:hypothetical protein
VTSSQSHVPKCRCSLFSVHSFKHRRCKVFRIPCFWRKYSVKQFHSTVLDTNALPKAKAQSFISFLNPNSPVEWKAEALYIFSFLVFQRYWKSEILSLLVDIKVITGVEGTNNGDQQSDREGHGSR